ncbi:hypothetical protein PUR71_15980 [Streptomyces sp. SP17BM10]|uniref:hypothetical protein n=1 Tax=Streptomyces sp. SP17BM10 TaxID=3002530 RepID=UPI002E7873A0|nr:hypothetical protein [Streptomyces sp. SP17BM10]MEE1784387.1 hypothetical protein [Streptomyces sp. SP17BM10]
MGPGVVVTGLTLGALAVVSLLAFQANGAQDRAGAARPTATATAGGPATSAAPSVTPTPTAPTLPASSGTGTRVVYSVSSHYVWLIEPKKNPQVVAAFPVTPGTVEPTPGAYPVYSRTATTTGTDGKQIEHVVRFAQQNGVVFGFSAAVDGATPSADPKAKTGGIRSSRPDGQLLWDFAPKDTKVVVVA